MNKTDIVSQHIGSLLCRSDISVTDMLGIQSQSLRYSKWVAKVRGIDMDAEPERYFRAWTLRGTMHIHEVSDYDLYMHEGNHSPYMKEYWDDHFVVSHAVKCQAEDQMPVSQKEKISSDPFRKAERRRKRWIICLMHGVDFPASSWNGVRSFRPSPTIFPMLLRRKCQS